MKKLNQIKLTGKRVFLRADLNVPLKDNLHEKTIAQDHRLQATLPTIDYIQEHGGKVILATHIGRPPAATEKNFFDENLSTKLLIPWFEQHGYTIDYEIDLLKAIEKSKQHPDRILLLENLRFFNGEQQTNNEFAQLLAQSGNVYINDAFGVLHRNDTSVTLLPKQFDNDHRAFGLLVEKELETLTILKKNPTQPYVVVLGGSKATTKLPVLEKLIDAPLVARPQSILVGGLVASQISQEIVHKAKQNNVNLMLPIDRCTIPKKNAVPTVYEIDAIPPDDMIVDIGPKTIELFSEEIAHAKTIFANGTMGVYEDKRYETGSKKILQAIANTDATSIIGGGDAGSVFQGGLSEKSGRGRSFGLSTAGDVDGDGRDDILIGSVLADPRLDPNSGVGVKNGGEAYLIYSTVSP